ncbi:hypothetical protein BDK51DRAFT_32378 [Blyttiomyces helicus]|uniref:Uncharacterized protein n=1 Tax=Blyttiomyces helicus TaxID=388810 RepID=A0A4P9VXE1_9FUNG|nr:hypothetical protein BDK51DRAFT_32378 [Blyttiomyces helicus]|eukprot:RKO82960.1 hypothetical protein BDK51DRAFT_32378 [Blyttiomyces helicus]
MDAEPIIVIPTAYSIGEAMAARAEDEGIAADVVSDSTITKTTRTAEAALTRTYLRLSIAADFGVALPASATPPSSRPGVRASMTGSVAGQYAASEASLVDSTEVSSLGRKAPLRLSLFPDAAGVVEPPCSESEGPLAESSRGAAAPHPRWETAAAARTPMSGAAAEAAWSPGSSRGDLAMFDGDEAVAGGSLAASPATPSGRKAKAFEGIKSLWGSAVSRKKRELGAGAGGETGAQ